MTEEARIKAIAEVSHAIGGPGGMDHWLAAERFITMRDADDAWKAANHPNQSAREVPRVPIITTPQDPLGDDSMRGSDESASVRADPPFPIHPHVAAQIKRMQDFIVERGLFSEYSDSLVASAYARAGSPSEEMPPWLDEAAEIAYRQALHTNTGTFFGTIAPFSEWAPWYKELWRSTVRAVLAFAARQPRVDEQCPACHWHEGHDPQEWFAEEAKLQGYSKPREIEITDEMAEIGIEAAAHAVSALPKGQQAWGKKEYMIAETAATAALQAALKVKS